MVKQGCTRIEVGNYMDVDRQTVGRWVKKYDENGIEGLKSRSGKHSNPNIGKYDRHPSEIEKLKKELLKKEIEIERLKKGYQVKGGGDQKEYVTTFDVNTKS